MKHTCRASWVVLVACLSAGCSEDGGGGHGDAGDTDHHRDGGHGNSDKDGGPGLAPDAGEGTDGGADPGEDPDGGADPQGPMCSPLDELPPPVVATAQAAPACSGESPCGGLIDGTTWAYLDACVDPDVVFATMYEECPTAHLNGLGDVNVEGSLSFEGGVATHRATVSATGVFQAPVACHGCNCKDFDEVVLHNAGLPNAFCYEDCYPDNSCRCLIDFSLTIDESESYQVSGSSITLAGGRTYDYCSSTEGLSLTETSANAAVPASVKLVEPDALNTPEICDGRDNDHDGTVDEDPVDCPEDCNTKGVCADVQQVCREGAWVCEYASTVREVGNETKCDALDNDCDGEVDEGLTGCVEVCDGLDNDNDGTVDNHLADSAAACPTARGVCTAGVTAECNGASGWECVYKSAAYREGESLCDELDNDCDGLVDEGCKCATGESKMFILRMGATDAGIVRANLDGSDPELIVPIPQYYVYDLAIDPAAEKLYWYDFGAQEIRRANLDGTGVEQVWSGKTQAFAIDPGSPAVGFVEKDTYSLSSFAFASASTTTTIVQVASVSGMEVDPVNRHVYWTDHGSGNRIMRANYDGSNVIPVLDTPGYASDSLAIDPVHRTIYYNDGLGVHVVGFDGEGEKLVLPKQDAAPSDMALDLVGAKIYIVEENADQVLRADLDGKNIEPLLSGAVVEGAESIVLYICAP